MHHYSNAGFDNGMIFNFSKFTRIVVILLLVCLAAAGCSDPVEQCDAAVAALEDREELRLCSTTLVGGSEDAMETTATNDFWISRDSMLLITSSANKDGVWKLYRDGQYYTAMPEDGQYDWQTAPDPESATSWLPPEVDIGQYDARSCKDADGRTIITLTGDRSDVSQGTYGEGTTSGYREEYVLSADGALDQYTLSYTTSYPNAEGEAETLYWSMVVEFPAFEPGEVTAYLDELYADATK